MAGSATGAVVMICGRKLGTSQVLKTANLSMRISAVGRTQSEFFFVRSKPECY
jgi:hypothetical protein